MYKVAAALWFALSLWLLLRPESAASAGWFQFGWTMSDKFWHAALFFVQCYLVVRAWHVLRFGHVLGLMVVWAALSESLQGVLTSTRQASLGDAVADIVGALLALAVVFLCRMRVGHGD